MRVLPRFECRAVSAALSATILFALLSCSDSKPKPAPIVDSSQQGQQSQQRTNKRTANPPAVQFTPYRPPQPSLADRYFEYGYKTDPWNPDRGLAGRPAPLWVLIALSLGLLAGTFFSDRFRWLRRYVFIAIGILIAGWILTQTAPFAYVGWFLVGYAVAWTLFRIIAPPGRSEKPTTFGSAEWADRQHIIEHGLNGEAGFWLGTFTKDGGEPLPIHYTGDRHLLTVAPTRAGKGVSSIIPNLLTYAGSAIVIDPKGENALITARQRAKLGQAIHVIDPWGITDMESSRFNPLEWLDPADPDVGENALMLADALIVRDGKGDDRFWDDEAAALLWGFILYAATDPDHYDRTLGGVRDIINAGPNEMDTILAAMAASDNPIISSTASRTLGKDAKLRSNVFTTLQSHTHFLDSPRMRESLSQSDFRFENLKTSKMTVYLVLPADRLNSFGRWLRLLIQQAITVNARNIAVKPDKPILFLLDEMAALGKLTKVEEAYGLMAGFGMQLWGIVQDLSQLDRIYDKGWETFIGNSGVLQYFGSRDMKTAEYFSKLCGVTTIVKVSISRSIARAFGTSSGPGGSSSNRSTTTTDGTNTDHAQRHLVFPDELMVMRRGQSLVLIGNNNPIQAQRITWYSDPRLRSLGVDLQKGLSAGGHLNTHQLPGEPFGRTTAM